MYSLMRNKRIRHPHVATRSIFFACIILLGYGKEYPVAQPQTQSMIALQKELDAHYQNLQIGTISEDIFTENILVVSANQNSTQEALHALQTQRERVKEEKNSIQLHQEIALLAEMTARYDIAIDSYKKIVQQSESGSRQHAGALLKLAILYFNSGDFSEALASTQKVLSSSANKRYVHRAQILQIRIVAYAVDPSTAIERLNAFIQQNSESPELLLAYTTLAEFYHYRGDSENVTHTQERISKRFPSSIEARYDYESVMNFPLPVILIRKSEDGIAHYHEQQSATPHQHSIPTTQVQNNPEIVHNASHETVLKIQTGSFKMRANAEALRAKLETLGLHAVINTISQVNEAYYKVRVLTTEYERTLSILAQHDIGGFLVNE